MQSLATSPGAAEVTVTLIAGPDRQTTEQTVNSFLTCCLDVSRVGHFLVLDADLSAPDRAKLRNRYGFLKFARRKTRAAARAVRRTVLAAPRRGLAVFRPRELHHLPDRGTRRRTTGVSGQHQLRRRVKLIGASAAEHTVRRAPDAGRYLLTDEMASGPAMFDTTRLDRAANAGLHTATLDEVLCISGPAP